MVFWRKEQEDDFDTSGERRAKEKQMMAHEMSLLDDDNRGLDAWERSVLNQYGPEAGNRAFSPFRNVKRRGAC